MDTLLQDLRYALRRLRKTPAFTTIVLVTLALGIGANTAIFSVVNGVLLKPLPYRAPDQLVTIEHFYPSLDGLQAPVSAAGFRDYRDQTGIFSGVAVQSGWGPNLTGIGDPQRLTASRVSAQYFSTLGVAPALGRTMLPEEDEPGRNHVVVLSHGAWQRLFGGERSALGKQMSLNGESYEIIGIMPPDFRDFFNRDAELWVPVALTTAQLEGGRTNEWLNLTARLGPGVTTEQAASRMATFAEQLKTRYPDSYPDDWSLRVTALDEEATGQIRPALLLLLGAVGFVLLIACANVANLLLARAATRSKEVAIRAALGAERRHLIRQLLTESMLLALAGGALGLLLAFWGVRGLVALNPDSLPRGDQIGIDAVALLFTVVLSLLTGVLFGLVPAVQTSRTNLQSTLKEGGRSAAADRSTHAVRRVLVVAEVALALTLLVGAGLLIKSFARLQQVDPGFQPDRLLTLDVALPQAKYPNDTTRIAFFDQLLPRIAALPGVKAVGATSVLPFGGGWSTGSFNIEGLEQRENEPGPWGDIRLASPGFFGAMEIPLVAGRVFTEQDDLDAPPVAVVDEEMVRRFWPGQDPIGKRLSFGAPDGEEAEWITVVGVVGHAAQEGLDADARVQLYLSYRQSGPGGLSLAVRTATDPLSLVPAVRQAVQSVDRDQPISRISTMDARLSESVGQRRLSMLLLGLFAGLALLLAAIGIYGVMSYAVTQRSHELGVRMALGAARGSVLGLVMRQGMGLALIGVVIGLLGAFALTRLIESQLYDVPATDPVTFVVVSALLTAIALLAIFIPALRATRVDPVVALREE